MSVKCLSQICHEDINKPLDGTYLADFGIDLSVPHKKMLFMKGLCDTDIMSETWEGSYDGRYFPHGTIDRKHLTDLIHLYTANILTVLSTAFGSVTFPTVIWLHILQPNIALSLKLYSSKSVTFMCTANGCGNPSQITLY